MKAFLRNLFFALMPHFPVPKDRALILMYHSISDRTDYFSAVSPAVFERQMRYLKEHGVPVISLAELVRRLRAHEPLGGAVALTFDDGYRDNFTAAFPVLERYRFPATIFAATDFIGQADRRNLERLSTDELRALDASGLISIEPHTRSHPRLSCLSAEAARDEIVGSKRFIKDLLGRPCDYFAYPWGDYDATTVDIVRALGFNAAVTVREGTVGHKSDPFLLPRVSIDHSTTFAQFKGKLSTAVDWYHGMKSWR